MHPCVTIYAQNLLHIPLGRCWRFLPSGKGTTEKIKLKNTGMVKIQSQLNTGCAGAPILDFFSLWMFCIQNMVSPFLYC